MKHGMFGRQINLQTS